MFAYLTEIVQANVLSLYANEPDELYTCTKHNFQALIRAEILKFPSIFAIFQKIWKILVVVNSEGSIFDLRRTLGLSSSRILNQKLLLRGADLCTPNVCL